MTYELVQNYPENFHLIFPHSDVLFMSFPKVTTGREPDFLDLLYIFVTW